MWQTIESDPGLFTELVENWGVKGLEFNEILGVDPSSFHMLHCDNIYGVIFLFNHTAQPDREIEGRYATDAPVYFAKQMVEDSCATQALLGLVLSHADQIQIGSELENINEFSKPLDPEMRGEIIGSSEFLRGQHSSMCAPPMLVEEADSSVKPRKKEDAFHYVAYVPKNGHLYEIDGLQPAPIDHGEITDGDVVGKICSILQQRIAHFGDNQLGFSVMVASNDLRTSTSQFDDPEWIITQDEKRAKWKEENQLRRFDYTGLALELLKQIAAKRSKNGNGNEEKSQ